ncbi:hypothetical protein J6590_009932 [Homalodisca vitripennis]|nr:hypothetical protein J6590_009932 [Homalodisca vitripennis]
MCSPRSKGSREHHSSADKCAVLCCGGGKVRLGMRSPPGQASISDQLIAGEQLAAVVYNAGFSRPFRV